MKYYVWCEDQGSGYQFWKALFSSLYPDHIVETKNNNSKLNKAAEQIKNDGNIYYILIDDAVDNPDVMRETKRLYRTISGKNNVRKISIHSFEFSLLSFEMLENWVFAENDDLKDKRRDMLEARRSYIKLITGSETAAELNDFKNKYNFSDKKNTEMIAAKILYEITRNTGFETDKSQVGHCFINNCCEWADRQADDICGLNINRLTLTEKMEQIIEHSVLQNAFKEAGIK
ncbi:hypothetical protein [Ruminococcus sp. NK3A76]|uniref:hypothetical protein n=1 Tax=Ruminococcus sp. NK3A76 TaxID=877411 RepID=UPI00068B9DA9|nr:hypothetical protein [Ruminococcus sp. NK3A76]